MKSIKTILLGLAAMFALAGCGETNKIETPKGSDGSIVGVDVPASLDKQARAALASAYYFQYHWFGMHAGFMPFESVEGLPGWF